MRTRAHATPREGLFSAPLPPPSSTRKRKELLGRRRKVFGVQRASRSPGERRRRQERRYPVSEGLWSPSERTLPVPVRSKNSRHCNCLNNRFDRTFLRDHLAATHGETNCAPTVGARLRGGAKMTGRNVALLASERDGSSAEYDSLLLGPGQLGGGREIIDGGRGRPVMADELFQGRRRQIGEPQHAADKPV